MVDYRLRHGVMHKDPPRMLANRVRVLGAFYTSPDLPGAVTAARLVRETLSAPRALRHLCRTLLPRRAG